MARQRQPPRSSTCFLAQRSLAFTIFAFSLLTSDPWAHSFHRCGHWTCSFWSFRSLYQSFGLPVEHIINAAEDSRTFGP
jgi:hypothetical protein